MSFIIDENPHFDFLLLPQNGYLLSITENTSRNSKDYKMNPSDTNGTTFKPVTHVIFDMDGLLLNSEESYYKIDLAVIDQFGKTAPDHLQQEVLGFSDIDCAKKVVKICELPITPEEYVKETKKFTHLLKDVTLLPGAERLIRHLAKHNIPIAIATSSGTSSVEAKLQNHQELFSLFRHMVMASSDPEVTKGKPHPDIFQICARRFPDNPDPEKCLVFEDAPSGVTAARKAGMQVVFVPNERLKIVQREIATLVLNSLLEFVPEEFGLPPF
ncbi:probable pseudouridine-5'-phosphatase [Planococcus citri]|uniref:probable pseudouridine-5'-phosphatase n=1 Tax=Planococcus citri TaxID=170843 RepID=UPI0031F80F74